jgi:rare lipoprotein A
MFCPNSTNCLCVNRFLPRLAFFVLLSGFFVSGCTQLELASHFGKRMSGSSVQSVGTYKVGSPYTVGSRRYYPAVDYNYDKTGIASWYGPNFHGKSTANGEIYDQNELTAAHKTLPLPSIVRVTNLGNGRSLVVRVNDRGPYAHGRIIDLSKRSAELLGFRSAGLAKVRVQVLETESMKVAEVAKSGRDTSGMEVPMNRPSYKPSSPVRVASTQENATTKYASMKKPTTINNADDYIRAGSYSSDTVSTKMPIVKPPHIFVQTGAFSSRESAMKFASSLDGYGRAQISDITVGGEKYYRVRIPAQNVPAADSLMVLLAQGGHKNALIVVD